MNSEIVELPENVRLMPRVGPKSDPEIVQLAKQVIALKPGSAVRVTVSSSFQARIVQARVRHYLQRHLGHHMNSRTDGLGGLYLMKGEKCAS